MPDANPYFPSSKLPEGLFSEIIDCFAADLTATRTSAITGVSVRSVNPVFLRIRQRLAESCESPSPWRGEPAEGAPDAGRRVVLGLLEQEGAVHAEIAPPALKAPLQSLMRGQSSLQSVLGLRGWRGYHGLVDLEFERFCILGLHCGDRLEAFWGFMEARLRKFYGFPGHTFLLHVKECEFRFNNRGQDLRATLRNLLKLRPL